MKRHALLFIAIIMATVSVSSGPPPPEGSIPMEVAACYPIFTAEQLRKIVKIEVNTEYETMFIVMSENVTSPCLCNNYAHFWVTHEGSTFCVCPPGLLFNRTIMCCDFPWNIQ